MKQYDGEKPLISIHIPKCGGTSFMAVLRSWFGKNLYIHYFEERRNKMPRRHNLKSGLFERRFKKGICIHGHFNKKRGFGVRDYYPEVDQFITVLRDPFEMALSNYFFVKKQGDSRFRDGKILRMEDQYQNLNDYLRGYRSYLLYHMPSEITMENYKEILERDFVYIGLLEDFQTSVNMLAKKLGFPEVNVDLENISSRDEEVSRKIEEEFISNHQLEYAIYDFALRNYKQ